MGYNDLSGTMALTLVKQAWYEYGPAWALGAAKSTIDGEMRLDAAACVCVRALVQMQVR
jgi:hypothetical protein